MVRLTMCGCLQFAHFLGGEPGLVSTHACLAVTATASSYNWWRDTATQQQDAIYNIHPTTDVIQTSVSDDGGEKMHARAGGQQTAKTAGRVS